MIMERKVLLGSVIAAAAASVAILIFVPASRPENCWDCPLTFEQALSMVAVIVTSVTLGTWLRVRSSLRFRALGNVLLGVATLYIWVIHHAGREWGISRLDSRYGYDPNAVSMFALLLFIVCAAFVMYFGRRSSSRGRQPRDAGDRPVREGSSGGTGAA